MGDMRVVFWYQLKDTKKDSSNLKYMGQNWSTPAGLGGGRTTDFQLFKYCGVVRANLNYDILYVKTFGYVDQYYGLEAGRV